MTPDDPRHGTRNGYRAGCRETCCVEGNRAYFSHYYRTEYRKHLGYQGRVDATPALDHLAMLMRHASIPEIAAAAGVGDQTIRYLVDTPPATVRVATHDRLMALTPATIPTRLGLTRRMRALTAIGWPLKRIAVHAGISPCTARQLRDGEPVFMQRRVRDQVLATYETLSASPPAAASRGDRSAIARARNLAASHGWAPPLAWDCIDDPYEVPAVTTETRAPVDLDEFLHLVRGGIHVTRAAERLGVTLSAIERAAERQGRDDVRALVSAERSYQRKGVAA